MTENLPVDDTEGLVIRSGRADAERDETDDVDGHAIKAGRSIRTGRSLKVGRDAARQGEPDDDVSGHLSGALGQKKHDTAN